MFEREERLVEGWEMDLATGRGRKRKADIQDNERLNKRLSLLNIGLYSMNGIRLNPSCNANSLPERDGREKLYVPVEQPISETPPITTPPSTKLLPRTQDEDIMQLDDTKHKVYIYDLDAELSDSESDDGKLVFLPDIQKHLRESRIPPSIMANSEGELAGNTQLVLYSIPSSLTLPEEQDSVRKAIIETRARVRAKQEEKRMEQTANTGTKTAMANGGVDSRDWYPGLAIRSSSSVPKGLEYSEGGSKKQIPAPSLPPPRTLLNRQYSQQGYPIHHIVPAAQSMPDNDPDAMDLG